MHQTHSLAQFSLVLPLLQVLEKVAPRPFLTMSQGLEHTMFLEQRVISPRLCWSRASERTVVMHHPTHRTVREDQCSLYLNHVRLMDRTIVEGHRNLDSGRTGRLP